MTKTTHLARILRWTYRKLRRRGRSEKMAKREDELAKARFFYDMACDSLSRITESNRRIDEKIQNMLALTATLTPLLLGLFYYILTTNTLRPTVLCFLLLFISSGIVAFCVATLQGLRIYRPWPVKTVDPVLFRKEVSKLNLLKIVKGSAGNIGDIANKNRESLWEKAAAYRWMLGVLGVGMISFLSAFAVLAVSLIVN
jgi:hypothetical protein